MENPFLYIYTVFSLNRALNFCCIEKNIFCIEKLLFNKSNHFWIPSWDENFRCAVSHGKPTDSKLTTVVSRMKQFYYISCQSANQPKEKVEKTQRRFYSVLFFTFAQSYLPRTTFNLTPIKSCVRPFRTSTILCSCKLWPSPGTCATYSFPPGSLTRTHRRLAELGFLGFLMMVFKTTPLAKGFPDSGNLRPCVTFGKLRCVRQRHLKSNLFCWIISFRLGRLTGLKGSST
jgi:hypothetical protein